MANYITFGDADTYLLANKLNITSWTTATDAKKTVALTMATSAIDKLSYKGSLTATTQANEFPRSGDTLVPQAILDACAELAFEFIDGADVETEIEDLNILIKKFGTASIKYKGKEGPSKSHIAAGILSVEAWKLLLPYMSNIKSMKYHRI